MDTLTKQRMTVDEFLVWAEAQTEGRYELVRGEVVRMSPERIRHNLGKAEIWSVIRQAARAAGLTNTVFTDGVTVITDRLANTGREPDCIVAAGSDHDPDSMTVDDPLIIVEVVSPSTEKTDTVDKLAEYFTIPTVRHYVIVRQTERVIEHHARGAKGRVRKRVAKPGDTLKFDPPGFEVAVDALLA